MAGVLVQSKFVHVSATTASVTFAAAVTSGNTVILKGGLADVASSMTGWTDDQANSYTSDYAVTTTANSAKVEFRRLTNVTNGPITFTLTVSATRDCSLCAEEWSGLHATPLGQTGTANGTGFSISTNVTTTTDNEIATALVINTDGVTTVPTAGTGWTLNADNTTTEFYHNETKVLGAAGTYAADMSVANNNFLDIIVATYKIAAASTPAKHLRVNLGMW